MRSRRPVLREERKGGRESDTEKGGGRVRRRQSLCEGRFQRNAAGCDLLS